MKKVRIEGFWDRFNVQTEFNQNVNIFVGRNGTGKTTFINILQAILTVNLPQLQYHNFSRVRLSLVSSKSSKTITVTKKSDDYSNEWLNYKIANKNYKIPLTTSLDEYRNKRIHRPFIEVYNELKSKMEEIVNVSFVSVHRETYQVFERDGRRKHSNYYESSVDRRLNSLMNRFARYQLTLESKASKRSKEFQIDVLNSTLYDESLDSFDLSIDQDIELDNVKAELINAFKELKIPIDKKRIDAHIKVIRNSIEFFQEFQENENNVTRELRIDDFLHFSLLQKTKHIISLSNDAEKDKREIFKHRTKYLDVSHEFVDDKLFNLSQDGELLFEMKDTNKKLTLEQLSSGEKQLLILLTEILLQENEPYIFITDEPELSLHIGWQDKLLSTIKSLNENAQLIIATHSPEIVSEFKNSTFNMMELLNE